MSLTKRHFVAVPLALLLLATSAGRLPSSAAPTTGGRPNVLIIVTDDQRAGLGHMPATRKFIEHDGVRFVNGFVTTPWCCPSRASIFTGRYTHNHHVFTNGHDATSLAQKSTLQYYLHQAGYETGLYGKYLNGWPWNSAPPYFDQYAVAHTAAYKDATWNVNGVVKTIPDYNTTYISKKARKFMGSATHQAKPWFLYLATAAPHSPFRPQRKYEHARVGPWAGDPAVFEKDRSDKPPYVQEEHAGLNYGRSVRRAQFRTQLSVDDMVSDLFAKLRRLREARRTLVFFISDNGLMWAEHGLRRKRVPYDQAIRVPFMVRWRDHFLRDAKDSRLVANIDIAPTVLEATGVTADPAYPMDGRSLLGFSSRNRLLTEQFPRTLDPTDEWHRWASTRTKSYMYAEYYDEAGNVMFREYYDLRADPWELHNLLGDSNPGNDPDVAALSAQLAADRVCEGTTGPSACP